MNGLKRCPCGKVPNSLFVTDANQGGKYANVNGDCCGEWTIEFRTGYSKVGSDDCMSVAVAAWNDAPRAKEEQ
jgi:hypothetical protein